MLSNRFAIRHRSGAGLRQRPDRDQGFTLIEIIVAIAVLAVIITPLTMAFITMLQRTGEVDGQISRSADAQRIGAAWTQDVQNVDVGGINAGGTCPSAGGVAPVEIHLVSFTWDGAATTDAPKKTASWMLIGSGSETELIRRYCENDAPVGEQLLADSIGVDDLTALQTVHGPVPAENPSIFCPPEDKSTTATPRLVSDSCTIVIEGSFDYEVTATRRVPERDPASAPGTAPPPPTVDGVSGRNSYVTVIWTPPPPWDPPVDGYRAFAYLTPGGSPVATTCAGGAGCEVDSFSTSADLTGLANGTPYYVRVQSHNSVGWGELSPASGPVQPQPTGPDAATIVSVAAGDTTIDVSWTPNANDGGAAVQEWNLYAVSSTNVEVGPIVITDGAATSGTITGVTNADTYTVTVEPVNSIGAGLRSEPSEEVIPYGVPGLATITSLTQLPNGQLRVTWDDPSTPPANASDPDGGRDIDGYRIEVVSATPSGGGGPWPSGSTYLSATEHQYDLDGLTLGSEYTVRILTHNLRGTSSSDPSAPPALAAAQPDAPVVTATQSVAGSIVVSWVPPPPNGSTILDYEVSVSPAVAGSPRTVTDTSTTFTGLTSGTNYTFTVRARNVAGQSDPGSASARALGIPSAPNAPSIVRQAGNNYPFAVNLTWSRPANDGGACVKAYRIEYSANASTVLGTQTLSSSPNATCGGEPARSLAWSGLLAGVQTRYFRVVAINTGDLEAASGWGNISMVAQCTVTATEDSWVNEDDGGLFSSSKRGNNYGTDSNLRVDASGDRLFVKFDPRSNGSACTQLGSALPADAVVTGGTVSLYMNDNTNRTHTVARTTGGWSEGNITYNNQPGRTNDTSSHNAGNNGRINFSVSSSDVEAERNTATRFGWNVRDTGGNIFANWGTYTSREGTSSQRPELVISFY